MIKVWKRCTMWRKTPGGEMKGSSAKDDPEVMEESKREHEAEAAEGKPLIN